MSPDEVTPGTSSAVESAAVYALAAADYRANVQIWTYGGGTNQQWAFQAP